MLPLLTLAVTGCLSLPSLNPPCPNTQVFERKGYTDGFNNQAKQLPHNSNYCKEEVFAARQNLYDLSYERGVKNRCSDDNIRQSFFKSGELGQNYNSSTLIDCKAKISNYSSISKSSWNTGLNSYCKFENVQNTFEAMGKAGSEYNFESFAICSSNRLKSLSKKTYTNALKVFCSLDNIYNKGLTDGDSGRPMSSNGIKKCEKYELKAINTYISGYNRGAIRLEQRKHREEQARIAQEQLEEQRRLVEEQTQQINSNQSYNSPVSCRVKNHSGTLDISFCRSSNNSNRIRCYAEIEYENGSEKKIMGSVCVRSYSDCWSKGVVCCQTCMQLKRLYKLSKKIFRPILTITSHK